MSLFADGRPFSALNASETSATEQRIQAEMGGIVLAGPVR
jgi:uncharacterized membrane protein